VEFIEFPKIPRLSRECVISEKIDGTNAQVFVVALDGHAAEGAVWQGEGMAVYAGSRSRWITPADDNFGFAAWVEREADQLICLGEGRHFGEWWGQGIQRKYGQDRKRFSLFNVSRWDDDRLRPACCDVVPVLYRGDFTTTAVDDAIAHLRANGSKAAPGFMNPEGVVVFHLAGNVGFKKTLHRDEVPKSMATS
jgi:hypothetical protein